MALTFETVDIPTISYTNNEYVEPLKGVIENKKALTFTTAVDKDGLRKTFDRIKRDLRNAGVRLDITVRSHVFDVKTGYKFSLPSLKGAKLELKDGKKVIPFKESDIKEIKVVFWTTDQVIKGTADDSDNDSDVDGQHHDDDDEDDGE